MHLSRQQPRWNSNRWITAMQAATNTMLCSSVSLNNPKKKTRRRSCDSMPHFAAKCHAVFWVLACRSAPTLMTWAAQSKNKTKHKSVTRASGRAIYWQGWALQYCKEKLKGGCSRAHRVLRITYDQIRIRGIACKMSSVQSGSELLLLLLWKLGHFFFFEGFSEDLNLYTLFKVDKKAFVLWVCCPSVKLFIWTFFFFF